jgi:hypothetical protein
VSQSWKGIDRHRSPGAVQSATQGEQRPCLHGLDPQDYDEELQRVTESQTPAQAIGLGGRIHMKCPHCQSAATVRTSREVSALVREVYYQCNNVVCGHTFKATVEIVKTLSPAACPDPRIAAQLDAKQPGR